MKKCLTSILLLLLFSMCDQPHDNWINLLDEDLSQWDTFLSYRHKLGYNGEIPTDDKGNEVLPIGLNPNGYNVFSMINENDENILRVSGEIYGCIISKEEYANYHLKLKVKWGDKKYEPRKKLLKDSGILYHSIGDYGADYWRTWMLSQELQIMEGHMGDYWSQLTSAIDIKAYLPEYIMNPVADESQSFLPMGQNEEIAGFCLRSANYEKPNGEWNTIELICFEDKSLHIVNGNVVMILQNSRYIHNGKAKSLTKGKIQIQSEAAEVFYKDIQLKHLNMMPAEYKHLFD
ncbi:3-keto-disaccharide hydrolase [Carboxylicivirga linearis]|uniref:DUF1080 domain-containing protein n=1 Tax=Carboxylicivirga linearis TaxID=1628157 RepID=A0ABS5JYS3_9BACT|nr:DUF1080 domain-containing protein [Carboxylicivirga linearis]MBS2100053.1 DUF1080 domain-containing protein [Carboxylicivirga linearis]